MKILFLFLFSCAFLLAKPIFLNNELSSVNSINHQITIEDVDDKLNAKKMLEEFFSSTYSKSYTKYTNSTFWTKFVIKNKTNEHKEIILKNPRAGIDEIDIYIYESHILKKTYKLGDLREQKLRPLSSTKSVFPLVLNPYEEITVITRFKSLGPMYLGWDILSFEEYNYTNNMEMIFYAVFGGIMFALIIYNMVMFFNLKEITFLFYSLHGISFLWFQYAYNGMLYFLNIGINLYFLTISTWITTYLMILFLLSFTVSFFKLKEINRFLYRLFVFFNITIFLIFLLTLYLLFDSSLVIFTSYSILFILMILWFILILAFYAVYKKIEGAIYFLIGEGVYILSSSYVLFTLASETEISNTLQYLLIPCAILVEMIFLSIALGTKVGKIKRDNHLINKILNEEEKFSSVGKSIANLTHQWKKPISQLSSQLMYLESLHQLKKDEVLLNEFSENIEQMNTVIKYMKNSVDEIYDFYSNSERNTNFNLKKQIDMVCTLQSNNIILSSIDIVLKCSADISVVGFKHSFSNVLMILFDNSISQFALNKIQNPIINIWVNQLNNKIEIIFSDNAGGFDSSTIGKIFIAPYTTKGKNGSGLGLLLAKKLVEERLNGKISVTNIKNGASFKIILRI